jgi:hypothetical protein
MILDPSTCRITYIPFLVLETNFPCSIQQLVRIDPKLQYTNSKHPLIKTESDL